MEKSSQGLHPTQRATDNCGKLGVRETHRLFAKWSALKIYMQVTSYELSRLYLGIYTNMYVHNLYMIKISKKEAISLQGSREGYMFRRRKGKEEMSCIL